MAGKKKQNQNQKQGNGLIDKAEIFNEMIVDDEQLSLFIDEIEATKKISPQQSIFVDKIVFEGETGAKAARSAQYKEKSAKNQACRLMRKPEIQDAIIKRRALCNYQMIEGKMFTLTRMLNAATFDVRRFFDEYGVPIPIHKLPAEVAAVIKDFKVIPRSNPAFNKKLPESESNPKNLFETVVTTMDKDKNNKELLVVQDAYSDDGGKLKEIKLTLTEGFGDEEEDLPISSDDAETTQEP